MKSGLTIVEMAQQIERQSKLKQDYLLDTRRLQVEPFGSQLYLHTFDDHDDPLVEPLEINQIAHRQIGTHLKIYNDATACVWRDGTWQLLEDTSKGFLLFVQSKSKEESAA